MFYQFNLRHVNVIAVLLDDKKLGSTEATIISFMLDYEQNTWIRKDIVQSETYYSYKGSFIIHILGQLYFLIPYGGTYIYNVKEKMWHRSSPLIKNKILHESTKLSIIRIPFGL